MRVQFMLVAEIINHIYAHDETAGPVGAEAALRRLGLRRTGGPEPQLIGSFDGGDGVSVVMGLAPAREIL